MPRKGLDNYPTHSSLARELAGLLAAAGYIQTFQLAFEPCAGAGQLARPLRVVFSEVFTNDIDKQYGTDFSFDATDSREWRNVPRIDWVITNPPFSEALPIIENALTHAKIGVAMLLRLSFLEPTSTKNKRLLYPRSTFWESATDQLRFLVPIGSPRPSFSTNGKTDSVTTAWYVWDQGWSWKQAGIACPFQFITDWRKS
jgi:hypothetical protein